MGRVLNEGMQRRIVLPSGERPELLGQWARQNRIAEDAFRSKTPVLVYEQAQNPRPIKMSQRMNALGVDSPLCLLCLCPASLLCQRDFLTGCC